MQRLRSLTETRHATLLMVLLLVGLLFASGCGGDDEGDAQGQPEAAAEEAAETEEETAAEPMAQEVVIGHVNPNLSNPILQELRLGQERAAEKLGWRLRALDADLSPEKQVTNIDTLVSLNVDGITTWTLDPGAADAAYQRASEAGIPIVGFNSQSEFINTNVKTELSESCAPFEFEAEYIAERIPNATVLVIGPPPVPALQNRIDCFVEAAANQDLEILEQQNNLEDTAQRGQEVAQTMLTKHPDAQAIWGYNDPSALGAAAALQAMGKAIWSGDTEGVIVVGNNADSDAIAAIRADSLTLTYDENLFAAGVEAIKAFVPVYRDGEDVAAMPADVLVKGDPFDSENIDEWVPPDEREAEIEDN